MPRGKVTSEKLKFVADTGETEVNELEKNTPAPAKFTLIEPEAEQEEEEDELVQSVHKEFSETMETTRPNFKFTLLLVTLFVAVNIGLIALLDDNKKSTPSANTEENNIPIVNLDKQVPATNAAPEKPVLAAQPEKPVLAPNSVTLQKPLPAVNSAPPAAPVAAAKEKPADKHQPGADLLSIIGKY